MKPAALIGAVLIVIGVCALVYQGFTYTSRDKVIDLGPIQATADREHSLAVSPLLGVSALAGGIVLLIVGVRKRAVL